MENVPGLANDGLFRELVKGLRALEYEVDSDVFDSADFGTPQHRRRLVLVAARGVRPRLMSGEAEERSVRDAIGWLADIAGRSGDPLHDHGERRANHVRHIIECIPKDGGSRADLGTHAQLKCHRRAAARGDGWGRDQYARMAWDRPAPTITGGCVNPTKGRFLHPEKNRAITLREALLLQGFPPDYRLSLKRGKYAAAELAGNAIPPAFVRAQALALRRESFWIQEALT
jgi:DNA (cytosine-5)-methyltransferase 1